MLGKLLQGRYQIVQVLSNGGFCQTYIAQDTYRPGYPTCVVKHLKPTNNHPESLQTLRRLFIREAQALKQLSQYDQVPELLAYFEDNLEFYLVQKFIAGHPLSAELLPDHRWTESQVVQMLQEVLGILELVHSHGLIHRDIKPSNLLRRQQDRRLVLIDFGSVKQAWTQVVTAQGKTSTTIAVGIAATMAIGTSGYMPTEQGRGRPRPNSDIYALGMIGIQALTGMTPTQLPEEVDTGELLWQHQAQVSAGLASILNKMVRYHFKDRYHSATEALQALESLTNVYPQTQPKAARQLSVTATTRTQVPSQKPIQVFADNQPEKLLGDKISSVSAPTFWNISVLLIGLGTCLSFILALIVGSYYSQEPSTPTSKIQNNSGSTLTKNTFSNIALANTLTGHTNMVWSVAIRPNDQTLVSSSGDKTIKLWNLRTGELLRTLTGHANMVLSVGVSRDSQLLASSSWDRTIKIWNLHSGELLRTLAQPSKEAWSVAISPDGQSLVSSNGNINNIWNLHTGELLYTLAGHSDTVWSVAINPNGQILASGSKDRTIKLWNLRTGKLLRTLIGHSDRVRAVAISPNDQTLVSGSWDKTIKIWNLHTGELLNTLIGHSGYVNSVAISPDGQILASGSDDHTIKLWNLRTGELLRTLIGHSSNVNSVAFNLDGKTLVSGNGDGTVKIWRL